MLQTRPFRVNILHGNSQTDAVLYPVPQSPLVGLQLDEEIASLLPNLVYDGFLEGHRVSRDDVSRHIHLVQKPGHGGYLVAFLPAHVRYK